MKPARKYIFKCKLEGQPVCIVADLANGFYADLLEECGIWRPAREVSGYLTFTVDYPLIIKYGDQRYEMKVGDQFTLS